MYLFEHRLNEGPVQPVVTLAPEYHLEFPANPDSLTAEVLQGGSRECAALLQRTTNGDLLGLIWHKGRVVHRSLVRVDGVATVESSSPTFRLEAGERYIHYCETVPEHFGRGLYPAMLSAIAAALKVDGVSSRVLILCYTNNPPSIRGIVKAGYSYVSTARGFALLGGRLTRLWWRSEKAPQFQGSLPSR